MTRGFSGALKEIADVAGEAAALAIAQRVGGRRVYIPATVSGNHWLVEAVGRAKAEAICRHFATGAAGGRTRSRGERVDIPLTGLGVYAQLRRTVAKRVHELDQEQKSAADISAAVGITTRTVERHRAAHAGRKKGNQGVLF